MRQKPVGEGADMVEVGVLCIVMRRSNALIRPGLSCAAALD